MSEPSAQNFWRTPQISTRVCGIRVLAARPLRVRENYSTELFGDYQPQTMLVRVWMRTAVRKDVTAFGAKVCTGRTLGRLCHAEQSAHDSGNLPHPRVR
jgi:hypothetical protein